MKCSKAVFLFSLLFPISVLSQPYTTSRNSEQDRASLLRKARTARLKTDILREIKSLEAKDKALFYAQLGEVLWTQDQKEGIAHLRTGVELGVNPATAFKSKEEKLAAWSALLSRVSEKAPLLAGKLIDKIRETKFEEDSPENIASINQIYFGIAQQMLAFHGKENLALEYALLSLRGKNPAVNPQCPRFLFSLKRKNENLASVYFDELMKTGRENEKIGLYILKLFDRNYDSFVSSLRRSMPVSQEKQLLELLLPTIRKEAQAIALKTKSDCSVSKQWGLKYLDDYKRLMPDRAAEINKALGICQNSDLAPWNKPDFLAKSRRSSQDFLGLAKEIKDKRIQAGYLRSAAIYALHNEKNYRLANAILDGIEPESRLSDWIWLKNNVVSKWIEDLFKNDDFAGIEIVLEASPSEYRPFIVIDSFSPIREIKPSQKAFALNLLNRARADFQRIDKFSPLALNYATTPTKFAQLTSLYVRFGFDAEAVASHEDSIKTYRRVSDLLPDEKKKQLPRGTSFYIFPFNPQAKDADFFARHFDRLYENIGKIDNPQIRLSERLKCLGKILEKPPSNDPVRAALQTVR